MVGGWPASLEDPAQREEEGRDTNTEPEVPSDAGLLVLQCTELQAALCSVQVLDRLGDNSRFRTLASPVRETHKLETGSLKVPVLVRCYCGIEL